MKNDELENARVKYQVAINKNTSESEILWNRYSAMLLINTILVSIFGFGINKESNFPLLNQIISYVVIIGLISCILWFFMTRKGFKWMMFWIEKAGELERGLVGGINPIQEGALRQSKLLKTEYASYLLIVLMSSIYFYILFIMYGMNPLLFIGYGIFCFIIGLLSDNNFISKILSSNKK